MVIELLVNEAHTCFVEVLVDFGMVHCVRCKFGFGIGKLERDSYDDSDDRYDNERF